MTGPEEWRKISKYKRYKNRRHSHLQDITPENEDAFCRIIS